MAYPAIYAICTSRVKKLYWICSFWQNDESDVEATEAEKKAEEPAAATADENGATEEQLAVEPSTAMTEPTHTAEILEPEAAQDPQTHAQVVEEEKRVDPDSVQVAVVVPAESVEESKVVADASVWIVIYLFWENICAPEIDNGVFLVHLRAEMLRLFFCVCIACPVV